MVSACLALLCRTHHGKNTHTDDGRLFAASDVQRKSESKERKKALDSDGSYIAKAETSTIGVVTGRSSDQPLCTSSDQIERTSLETGSSKDTHAKAEAMTDRSTVSTQVSSC